MSASVVRVSVHGVRSARLNSTSDTDTDTDTNTVTATVSDTTTGTDIAMESLTNERVRACFAATMMLSMIAGMTL